MMIMQPTKEAATRYSGKSLCLRELRRHFCMWCGEVVYPQRQARRMFTKVNLRKLESTKCHTTSLDLHTVEVIIPDVLAVCLLGRGGVL